MACSKRLIKRLTSLHTRIDATDREGQGCITVERYLLRNWACQKTQPSQSRLLECMLKWLHVERMLPALLSFGRILSGPHGKAKTESPPPQKRSAAQTWLLELEIVNVNQREMVAVLHAGKIYPSWHQLSVDHDLKGRKPEFVIWVNIIVTQISIVSRLGAISSTRRSRPPWCKYLLIASSVSNQNVYFEDIVSMSLLIYYIRKLECI